MKEFNTKALEKIQEELNRHRVYGMIKDHETLQIFMEHHVYSVWDFMSLVKFLQNHIAPARAPWGVVSSRNSRRFINSIVLEEESDIGLPDAEGKPTYASHFEMYCSAMNEVGANSENALEFSRAVGRYGFTPSVDLMYIPAASKRFMNKTISFLETGKPHVVAAAFALGREKIIPDMFRQLLKEMNTGKEEAPAFHYYLERHIHLDEDFHAPLSLQMLNELCEGDEKKLAEAQEAAQEAIRARIEFWDGVADAMKNAATRVA